VAERRRWEAATETMPLRHCPLAAATTESQQLHRQHCCDPRPGRRLAQANYCGLGRRARLPCPAPPPIGDSHDDAALSQLAFGVLPATPPLVVVVA